MARKVVLVSDLSGAEAPEEDFIQLIVREHPNITAARSLDCLPAELDKLKEAANLVVCEVKNGNGESKQVVVTLAEFRKVVKDDVLVSAAFTRGRKRGSTVNGNGQNGDKPAAAE
jgi:hypothetical protein